MPKVKPNGSKTSKSYSKKAMPKASKDNNSSKKTLPKRKPNGK